MVVWLKMQQRTIIKIKGQLIALKRNNIKEESKSNETIVAAHHRNDNTAYRLL